MSKSQKCLGILNFFIRRYLNPINKEYEVIALSQRPPLVASKDLTVERHSVCPSKSPDLVRQ